MKKNKLYMGLVLGAILLTGTSCSKPSGNGGNSGFVDEDETREVNQEIVSNNQCDIKLVKIEKESYKLVFDVEIKNKLEDKDISVSLSDVAVDSYMDNSAYIYTDVNASETKTEQFTVYPDSRVRIPEELKFTLSVIEKDNYSEEGIFVDKDFTIYPTGKNAATVTYPERIKGNKEAVIIDNDLCNAIVLSVDEDKYNDGLQMKFYFENKVADKHAMFYLDNFKINDSSEAAGSAKIADTVNPYCKLYSFTVFYNSKMKEASIDKATDISFDFKLYSSNTIDTPLCQTSFVYKL